MDFGVRQIRSSGQGSGSVEVTLPVELRDLVGLPCRVFLRDGTRPDIVLQPDLRRARLAFAALWERMATVLEPVAGAGGAGADLTSVADVADLPIAAFGLALRAPPVPPCDGAPHLAWLDGHALADRPPHAVAPLSRTLAAFGQALAGRIGIAERLAADFGAACGFVLTGAVSDPGREEACALAGAAVGGANVTPGAALAACGDDALAPGFWLAATPALHRVAEMFLHWTSDPDQHGVMRAAWRRGVAIDLNGG